LSELEVTSLLDTRHRILVTCEGAPLIQATARGTISGPEFENKGYEYFLHAANLISVIGLSERTAVHWVVNLHNYMKLQEGTEGLMPDMFYHWRGEYMRPDLTKSTIRHFGRSTLHIQDCGKVSIPIYRYKGEMERVIHGVIWS